MSVVDVKRLREALRAFGDALPEEQRDWLRNNVYLAINVTVSEKMDALMMRAVELGGYIGTPAAWFTDAGDALEELQERLERGDAVTVDEVRAVKTAIEAVPAHNNTRLRMVLTLLVAEHGTAEMVRHVFSQPHPRLGAYFVAHIFARDPAVPQRIASNRFACLNRFLLAEWSGRLERVEVVAHAAKRADAEILRLLIDLEKPGAATRAAWRACARAFAAESSDPERTRAMIDDVFNNCNASLRSSCPRPSHPVFADLQ